MNNGIESKFSVDTPKGCKHLMFVLLIMLIVTGAVCYEHLYKKQQMVEYVAQRTTEFDHIKEQEIFQEFPIMDWSDWYYVCGNHALPVGEKGPDAKNIPQECHEQLKERRKELAEYGWVDSVSFLQGDPIDSDISNKPKRAEWKSKFVRVMRIQDIGPKADHNAPVIYLEIE